MKIDLQLLSTPFGQLAVVVLLAAITIAAVALQDSDDPKVSDAPEAQEVRSPLPQIFQRSVARFEPITVSPPPDAELSEPTAIAVIDPPTVTELPLGVFVNAESEPIIAAPIPVGRLIPCETVFTLESNRLATPVVGLVSAEVWYAGEKIVPIGAEVHGRASLDHVRGRLTTNGPWTLVWSDPREGTHQEVQLEGIALSREAIGSNSVTDGTAGLPGIIFRSPERQDTKLFAASFLASATAALQDTRSSFTGLGESLVPAATARNATLAGTGAVLREYAQQIQEAIRDDGIYVRVPAGTPFYLYTTEPINRDHFGGSTSSKL